MYRLFDKGLIVTLEILKSDLKKAHPTCSLLKKAATFIENRKCFIFFYFNSKTKDIKKNSFRLLCYTSNVISPISLKKSNKHKSSSRKNSRESLASYRFKWDNPLKVITENRESIIILIPHAYVGRTPHRGGGRGGRRESRCLSTKHLSFLSGSALAKVLALARNTPRKTRFTVGSPSGGPTGRVQPDVKTAVSE